MLSYWREIIQVTGFEISHNFPWAGAVDKLTPGNFRASSGTVWWCLTTTRCQTMSPLFQKMSDCETDCAALNLSSCTLVDHTLADPHLLLLSKVEVDTDGCFNEAAYLAQVVSQHSPVFVGQQTLGQEDNLSSRHLSGVCLPGLDKLSGRIHVSWGGQIRDVPSNRIQHFGCSNVPYCFKPSNTDPTRPVKKCVPLYAL